MEEGSVNEEDEDLFECLEKFYKKLTSQKSTGGREGGKTDGASVTLIPSANYFKENYTKKDLYAFNAPES